MAIINSYPNDKDIQDRDAWIGTDSYNRQTRQYTAEAVAKYLNTKGKISISAQMVFKFVNVGQPAGSFNGPVDNSALTSLATMQLSIVDMSDQNVVAFLDYLVGNNILISKQGSISTFGHYTISSYTSDGAFYRLNLTNIGGNGNLELGSFYDFAVFTLSSDVSPTFIYNQNTPSATWAVSHNLNKFPSVSVVNNNDVVMYGDTEYIDNNNITITFSGGFSGKAYLN